MIKNLTQLEFTIGTRIYRFLCDQDSPTSEIKEVLFQISALIAQVESAAQAKTAEVEEPKPE